MLRRLASRLQGASDAAWADIARATAPLQGDAVVALWRRAGHRALWITSLWPAGAPLLHVLFAGGELLREFRPVAPEVYIARGRARGPAGRNPEYHAAFLDLWELAVRRLPGDATTAEVVLIAGALASRSSVDADILRRAWAPLAHVVSLAEVRDPFSPAA